MKKASLVLIGLITVLFFSSCGGSAPSTVAESKPIETVEDIVEETEPVEESEETSENVEEEIVYLESDPLPEIWFGEWVCVYSEANYFAENETILVKDYDNAVLYTNIVGDTVYELNRWFCYDEESQVIHIFNETPFEENWIRDSFEIKNVSDSEIVLSRVRTGQEVRFEKMDAADEGKLDSNTTGNINPEFKEAMDSYEAFMDEYVEFMTKYQSSDNSISMLADYAEYAKQYAELAEKLDKVDQNELTNEELAYYLEVTSRVTQKLAQIAK